MEQSPSWETNGCSASQQVSSTLWNPKVYYRLHKSPPSVPILSLINPLDILQPYFFEINFNRVLQSCSSKRYLSLSKVSLLPVSLSCYMLSPCNPLWYANTHKNPRTYRNTKRKYFSSHSVWCSNPLRRVWCYIQDYTASHRREHWLQEYQSRETVKYGHQSSGTRN
jgi:hypothetical protein